MACLTFAGTGELVASQMTANRPATFAIELIDKLSLVTAEELENVSRVSSGK